MAAEKREEKGRQGDERRRAPPKKKMPKRERRRRAKNRPLRATYEPGIVRNALGDERAKIREGLTKAFGRFL